MPEPWGWGHAQSILPALTTLAGLLAAILAWLAKLRWSKEFAAAKDETIKAKNAEIDVLKAQISSLTTTQIDLIKAKDANIAVLERELKGLQDLTPMKLKEYLQTTKEVLEEYNNSLQQQLDQANNELELKERDINLLSSVGDKNLELLETYEREKAKLEKKVLLLEQQLNAPRETVTFEVPTLTDMSFNEIIAHSMTKTEPWMFTPATLISLIKMRAFAKSDNEPSPPQQSDPEK